jgi:hypothetical protein
MRKLYSLLNCKQYNNNEIDRRKKNKLFDEMEKVEPAKRSIFMSNIQRFTEWLMNTCYSIYLRIKSFLSEVWEQIKKIFR